MVYKKTWDGEFLKSVLAEFQEAYNKKIYKERIPYDKWRSLVKLLGVEVEFDVMTVFFYVQDVNGQRHQIYMSKIGDNGFGDFFYNKFILEKIPMTVSNKDIKNAFDNLANAATLATSASSVHCDAVSSVTYAGDPTSWTYTPIDSTATKASNTTNTIHDGIIGSWVGVDIASKAAVDSVQEQISDLKRALDKKQDKIEKKEENSTMMKGFNFDFGPCGSTVRLSMYGMAVQNVSGEWVSYNPESKEIINVDVFNMPDGGKYMYKMPVAIADVKVGDVVIHNRVPMFVTAINENGSFEVTDVRAGETKNIIPTKNMFNFSFMTKIVSMFDFAGGMSSPSPDNPFGGFLPFLFLNEEGNDQDMLPWFFMMSQGKDNFNPMMFYFLMKDNKNIDPMMWMMMSGSFGSFGQK